MSLKGKNILVKIPGSGTSIVGEATTSSGDTTYQITDTTKRILSNSASISVHKYDSDDTAEAGTTTTNITMTAHGLSVGDLIINTDRSNAKRLVTAVPDVDNITVDAVTSQTSGDTIQKCPTESSSSYTLNRLLGKVTYGSAVSRTIYISGTYFPVSLVAASNEFNLSISATNEDATIFKSGGADYVIREQTILDVSGSISGFYIDTTYIDYLTNDTTVVIEITLDGTNPHIRYWGKLSSLDVSGAVDGLIEESVDIEGVNDEDDNCITII